MKRRMYSDTAVAFVDTPPIKHSAKGLLQEGGRIVSVTKKSLTSALAVIPGEYDMATEAIFRPSISQTISNNSYYPGDDVLSTQDIIVGTLLAFILAFGYSFLNGQSSSSSFVSWPSQSESDKSGTFSTGSSMQSISLADEDGEDNDDKDKTFNADSWKEMSRRENYVLYNTKIRQATSEDKPLVKINKQENRLVLLSLLVLFVPIFSVEFFFALSRQFMCEMGMEGELVQKLCSPLIER